MGNFLPMQGPLSPTPSPPLLPLIPPQLPAFFGFDQPPPPPPPPQGPLHTNWSVFDITAPQLPPYFHENPDSIGYFKATWINFEKQFHRTLLDTTPGYSQISCISPGDTEWTHIKVAKRVLNTTSLILRKEVQEQPENNGPIFILHVPTYTVIQVLRFCHMGTVTAPIEHMRSFILAVYQLKVGAVWGHEFSYQLVGTMYPGPNQYIRTFIRRPWKTSCTCQYHRIVANKENNHEAYQQLIGEMGYDHDLDEPVEEESLIKIRMIVCRSLKMYRCPGIGAYCARWGAGGGPDGRGGAYRDAGACPANFKKCRWCGRKFDTGRKLQAHVKNTHYFRT